MEPARKDDATRVTATELRAERDSYSMTEPLQDTPTSPTTLAPAVVVPADSSVLDMRGIWPIPLQCCQKTYTLPQRSKFLSLPFSASHSPPFASPSPGQEFPRQTRAHSPPTVPDPWINHLQLLGESCFAETMAIALSLGISRPNYINDHPSPFSRAPLVDYAHISADLQPTFEQRTLVHPRYLDCIIFPNFRSRAIELSSRGELDHCSLFLDLMHGGMICRGSQYPSADYGRSYGDAVPWSRQSWEARPWFIKKWSFLVGEGNPDNMESISQWWSTMRGAVEVSNEEIEEVGSVFSRHGGCNVGIRQTYDDPLLW